MEKESPSAGTRGAAPVSSMPEAQPAPAAQSAASAPAAAHDYMDRWSRNLRLYETLKGMGLFVSPIPETDDPSKIR